MSETEQELEQVDTSDVEPDEETPDTLDDEPDDDDAPDVEPEPEPPAEASYSPLYDPDRQAKVGASFDTYARALGRNYEEDANDLVRCPLCPDNFPGFILPADAGKMPQAVKDAVNLFLGYQREQEYRQDPETQTCARCGGEGKVATGSHVHAYRTRTCEACRGHGYTPPPNPGVGNGNGNGVVALAFDAHDEAVVLAESDAWGEPRILPDGRENPNYGKMPQFKVAVEPWGVTANLTAQDAV